jgi:hypothetical protein
MKYKVVLGDDGAGNANNYASFTFYTYNQAYQCALAWVEPNMRRAWLWDGESWTAYQ